MNRPTCPRCRRIAIVVETVDDGCTCRRRFGCPQCGQWSLGVDVQRSEVRHVRLADRIRVIPNGSSCGSSGIR